MANKFWVVLNVTESRIANSGSFYLLVTRPALPDTKQAAEETGMAIDFSLETFANKWLLAKIDSML